MFKRNREADPLDVLIARVTEEMTLHGPDSEDYDKYLSQLERLNELKNNNKKQFSVSPDVAAGIVGNLIGIVAIVGYEHANVMNTKASMFLTRNKT
jgi:hypothetical protein